MDHLGLLEREVAAMADALRGADPGRPVRSCPGWDVAALTAHLTAVHRWARQALDQSEPPPYEEVAAGPDDYADASQALVRRMRELPADQQCWTFNRANPTTSFWHRRQLQEVSVHRWDVEEHAIEPEVALDGIDEVVTFFLPRQVRAGRTTLPAGTLVVEAAGRSWDLVAGDGPQARISGDPAHVNLLLWGRRTLDEVTVTGDAAFADEVLAAALTP